MAIRKHSQTSPSCPTTNRLRLTPFEEYLLHEDRPDCPCWIVVKNSFSGHFDRAALQKAFDLTVERHPLLRSFAKQAKSGGWHWETLNDWRPQIDWQASSADVFPQLKPIDLKEAPGFHLLVVEHADSTEITFQLHHVICDGKALRDILYDLLIFYSREKGRLIEPSPLDDTHFPDRNRLMAGFWPSLRSLPTQLIGLWVSLRFQRKTIAPLIPHTPNGLPPGYPAIVIDRLSKQDFREIRNAALRYKVSVNDIFLRDLFATIGQWRKGAGIGDEQDWIRLILPVDMRKPADRFLSAANLTSIVTLDRRMKSLFNRKRLLERAHEDMSWVKHKGLRFTFWQILWFCRWWPKGIARFAHRSRCQGTMIFANHCQLTTRSPVINKNRKLEVPGAVQEEFTMISPLRPGTVAALVVGIYADSLLVNLHYDPSALQPAQARAFVNIFLGQLKLSAAS